MEKTIHNKPRRREKIIKVPFSKYTDYVPVSNNWEENLLKLINDLVGFTNFSCQTPNLLQASRHVFRSQCGHLQWVKRNLSCNAISTTLNYIVSSC